MAWIVKNSATMAVERREEPYLDGALKAELESELLSRYPTRQAAALPVLHALQHQHGWLPLQAVEEAAAFLDVPVAEMLDTASFYDDFWLEPKGKYLIWVCQSLTCELVGATELRAALERKLGIEPGQTTDDGRFTLMTVECLGSCGTAPCALVEDVLHEKLTPENLERIVDALD